MLFFCELYVIRDELALLGRTAHHPRSWASTSYNYNRSWASTSYAEERARDSLEPLVAEAREKWRTRFAEKHRFPRGKLHDVVGGGSVGSRGIERSGHLHHLWPWARLPRRRRQGVATGMAGEQELTR